MAPTQGLLSDTFGRVHNNLRISVTDRCNIRCFYCMPETGGDFAPASQLLSFEQILRFVSVAQALGITQIRITGGEPLLRPRLAELVEVLDQQRAQRFRADDEWRPSCQTSSNTLQAGLRRLNIHVDSLDRARFQKMTRRDDLSRVLDGIETALSIGYRSVKLNAVAIRGLSEPDIIPLARFARERTSRFATSSSCLSMHRICGRAIRCSSPTRCSKCFRPNLGL